MTANDFKVQTIINYLISKEIYDEDALRIILDYIKIDIKKLDSLLVELVAHYEVS